VIRGKLNLAPAFVCRSYHSGKVQVDTQFLAIAMRHLLESRHLSAPYAATFILRGMGNSRQSRPSSNPPPLPFEGGSITIASPADMPASITSELLAYVPCCTATSNVLGFVVVPFLPETNERQDQGSGGAEGLRLLDSAQFRGQVVRASAGHAGQHVGGVSSADKEFLERGEKISDGFASMAAYDVEMIVHALADSTSTHRACMQHIPTFSTTRQNVE
jgi:hypothetical protein